MNTELNAIKAKLGAFFALWLVLWAIPLSALGAACSDVYSNPDGVNETLASDEQLDLSEVSFADENWPASNTELDDGGYFYRGGTLGNGYELSVDGGEQARVFVNGSLSLGDKTELNASGDADQLLLVVNGSLSISKNSEINALIYATGGITVGKNSDISGGIAAEGNISTSKNVDISFESNAVSSGLLSGLCTRSAASGPVVLEANGKSEGPVPVEVGESVTFQVSASECPTSADSWLDVWQNAGSPQTESFTASPCTRSPSRTLTFDTPGEYSISYEARSCPFRLDWVCDLSGAWGTHGQDAITVDVQESEPLTCFNDDFERTSGLGEDWKTDVSSGNFEPQVVQEAGQRRLRMTEASGNQATAATLQKLLPADDNLVVLDFNYHAYGARGNGADGLAVVFSDASVIPQAGGFGGSLGYAQRTDQGAGGFAGGWIGIGLDEFGNYSNASSNEGREGGDGFSPNAVAIRGSGAGLNGYPYIAGASVNPAIDGVGPNASHSYRIIVDSRQPGSAIVKVFRDEDGGRDYGDPILNVDVLAANDDQADVPENFLLSFTGSTGASVNTHEISEIELCAQELEDIGEQVEYFEIKHDGQALTCTPADVSIRACMNDDCSERYPGKVEVEMAPSGWIGGDVFSFEPSDTDDEGFFNTQLQVTEDGPQDLRVVNSDPRRAAYSEDQCIGPNGGRSPAPCELEFLDAGLQFEVPKQTAHKPSDPIQIQALRQSDNDPMRCVPAFSDKERPVEFSFDYVEPDPRAASRPVVLETASDEASIAQGESKNLTLDFNEQGAADFTLTYDDAGKMLLNALFQGEPDTPEEGLQLTGESGWVSVPEGLCVEADPVCDEGNENCPVFGVAGEPFDLKMRAVGYSDSASHLCDGNPATPNFELANISLEHELKEPSNGVEGDLGETAYHHRIDGNGETISQQRVSEVGVFLFSADPGSGTYFGETVPGGTSKPIGRFRPAEFSVDPENGKLMPPCSAEERFAYIGQKIPIDSAAPANFEITALNAQEKTTQNYTFPGFQYLSDDDLSGPGQVEYGGEPYSPSTDGVNRQLTSPDEASGVMNYKITGDVVYEKSAGSRPDPSKPEFAVDLSSFNDGDGVFSSFDDMNKPQALAVPVPEFKVRYGRLRLGNTYGPETLPLVMPMTAEFWNGSEFVTNTEENGCWQYNPQQDPKLLDPVVAVNESTDKDFGLSEGEPNPGGKPNEPDDEDGRIWLKYDSDNNIEENNTQGVEFPVPRWLQDDFDGDGSLENPTATATFGVYRGHDRIIYWREVQ